MRIYYGTQANLPVKFISRQKPCLSATTQYWVNDAAGLPVMMVTGELTEKLRQAIEQYIIPQLQQTVLLPSSWLPAEQEKTDNKNEAKPDQQLPVCTLVYDREAYEPVFFERLYQQHRMLS